MKKTADRAKKPQQRSRLSTDLSELIRKIRTGGKLNGLQLAGKLGVTPTAVSAWERGTRIPSAESWVKLANLAKASSDALVCLQQAGVDGGRIFKLAEWHFAEHVKAEGSGPTVAILPATGAEPALRVSPWVLPGLEKFAYFKIVRAPEVSGLADGDVVVVDTSKQAMAPDDSLMPFWDHRVLIELPRQLPPAIGSKTAEFKPEFAPGHLIGRLFLEGPDISIFSVIYKARVMPWSDIVSEQPMRPREYVPHPLTVGTSCWKRQPDADADIDLANPLAGPSEDRARAELRLDGDFRILGRIVGWLSRREER